MKDTVLDEVVELLEENRFEVSECSGARSCFDVIARRDGGLYLIKVLNNIEGLTANTAHELKKVSSITRGIPLVVGSRLKSSNLMDGVLYERYGVHAVNPSTLDSIVSNNMPCAHSSRGSICARVNSNTLKRLRHRMDLTQEELAKQLGVTKQSVYRYESTGRMMLEVFERMQEVFEDQSLLLHEGIEFEFKEDHSYNMHVPDVKKHVANKLEDIGFSTSITNAPFDVVAKEKETVYTLVSDDHRRLEHKMILMEEIVSLVGGRSLCVSSRSIKSRKIPVLKIEELDSFNSPSELFDHIE